MPGGEELSEATVTGSGTSTSPSSATSPPAVHDKVDVATSEGLSILQKVLFLAVITACVTVYLRMNKIKEEDTQKYEKILA